MLNNVFEKKWKSSFSDVSLQRFPMLKMSANEAGTCVWKTLKNNPELHSVEKTHLSCVQSDVVYDTG